MPTATLHAVQAPLRDTLMPANHAAAAAEEAARYAVLRRMGSAIRHQIAGALQPINMMASLVERRVQAEVPNLESLRKNCSEMSGLSRSASAECVALMNWLAPHPGELVAVGEGVEDCLHLLATELSFRGFSVSTAAQDQIALVDRQALRTLLPASLMALTDAATHGAQVRITAREVGGQMVLSLVLTEDEASEVPGRAKAYRPLTWDDVRALAQAEGVALDIIDTGAELVLDVQERVPPESSDVRWG